MTDPFEVIGQNILSNECYRYKQKQPSRKIFNIDWISADEYRHEIADNYRDYRHGQKIGKNRKRQKKVIFRDQSDDYRDLLEVHRIDFPASTLNYPHQGNPAKSELLPTVYDNTLRRILAANTLDELESLTKRQQRLYTFKKGLKPTQGISIDSRSTTRQQRRRSLGHITCDRIQLIHLPNHHLSKQPSASSDHKLNDKKVSVNEFNEGNIFSEKDNYFLQLASECYNEGFLAHIKYLESIGERNAINNRISKQRKPRCMFENTNTTSRPQSAESNVSSSNSVEDLSHSTGVRGFISIVKRILRTRRNGNNLSNYDKSCVTRNDWKIRVNITRSSSPERLHSIRSSIQETQDIIAPSNHCIMSDILNSNKGQAQQINAGNESSMKRQDFHDLIENLNNLEISRLGSLPKIVLTDFSTSNIVVDSPVRVATKSHEHVIDKQQSLEVDLPSLSDYNSEARPP